MLRATKKATRSCAQRLPVSDCHGSVRLLAVHSCSPRAHACPAAANSSAAASRMTTARRDEVLDAEEQLFSAVAPVPVPPRPRVAEEAQRLRDQVAATQVPRYAEQFEELVPAAEIRVGVVSVEDIELQEEAMERARQQAAEEQVWPAAAAAADDVRAGCRFLSRAHA